VGLRAPWCRARLELGATQCFQRRREQKSDSWSRSNVQGNILSFPSENVATNQEGGLGEDAREVNDRSNCLRRQAGKCTSAASPFSSALPTAKFELKLIQYTPSHLAQMTRLNPMATWADLSIYKS
jgi:hypothetical protein